MIETCILVFLVVACVLLIIIALMEKKKFERVKNV